MTAIADLEAFLITLRAEGVPVGPLEIARLHHAFGLEPALDRRGLKALLACTLIKDEAHRSLFDNVFEEWCPPKITPAAAPSRSEPAPIEEADARSESFLGPAKVGPSRRERPPEQRPATIATRPHLELLEPLRISRTARIALAATTLAGIWSLATFLTPAQDQRLLFALGIGAWACTGLVAWQYRRRLRLPQPAPAPRGGPEWLPLHVPASAGPELLDPDELRTLVWGVEHFVSDEPTRRVDLKKTVQATAGAAGIPYIHFRRAVYPREVWLWQDDLVQDPAMERLAQELETSLGRAGLPVRRGWFQDAPALIRWRESQTFSPLVLEGHRQQALVAVLTDGEGMQAADRSELDRALLADLLGALRQWPRLVFVDFGRGRHGLDALVTRFGLRCILPEDLPVFLGAGELRSGRTGRFETRPQGDLYAWAAAAALAPEPLDPRTAFALLRALRLDLSPWTFEELAGMGEDLGGRIVWPPEQRIRLLNWLARAETLDGGRIPGDSLLGRALAFWQTRYAEERLRRRRQQNPLLPWESTLAEQRLRLEEALLALWRDPPEAADTLYALHRGSLRDEVRERLGELAAQDLHSGGDEVVTLPWRFEAQPDKTRWLLWQAGFAGKLLRDQGALRTPGTLGLAAGLPLGLGAVALLAIGGAAGLALCLAFSGVGVFLARRLGLDSVFEEARPEAPLEPETAGLDTKDFITTDPMEMVELKGGTFTMGSEEYRDEKPPHEVTVSAFAMSRYPITRELYREVMGKGPDEWEREKDDARLPANYVTWYDAIDFCNALSERQGLRLCYRREGERVEQDRSADGYRLPTEAEWEYAVRAGKTTWWFFGNDPKELGRYAWFEENSNNRVHPVGEKDPNPWGLHDMLGNVWEWCWDWYGKYPDRHVENPVGPAEGVSRVLRGGAFWFGPEDLHSASRYWGEPGGRVVRIGFRCVRAARRQP